MSRQKDYRDYGIVIPTTGHGDEALATCPQCSHTRRNKKAKCLSVNTQKEVWLCHHCDWRGSLKSGEEVKADPFRWVPKTYTKPKPLEHASLPDKVLAWFAERNIAPEVLERNKIASGMVYMPQVEEEVNVIQFPYYRGDELVNIKYRDGQKNFRMVSGAQQILCGLNDIEEVTIIVEGEMDKLALEVVGLKNAVSVPNGAPSPKSKDYGSKFDYLEACQEELGNVKQFILAVDSDEAGQKLEEELARRLGREKCLRVQWPKDCKDANEVLVKLGVSALQFCIDCAQPYPVEGLFDVIAVSDKVDSLYHHGLNPGESPGWKSLEEFYTVRPGEWTLVTGIPGHGKSEFVDAITVNLAQSQGWRFGVFSPENQPIERHIAKLAEKYVGKPFREGPTQRMTLEELNHAKQWINAHYSFIHPNEDALNLNNILELAKTLVFRDGITGLIIDPWNEIDHSRPQNLSETEYISQCLSKIRQFARRHGVHIWLIAHPTKLQKDSSGSYPVPTPYDVSGSAHWRNKADNCLSVWRDLAQQDKYTTEVHVQKVRFKEVGRVGQITLKYDLVTGLYSEDHWGYIRSVI